METQACVEEWCSQMGFFDLLSGVRRSAREYEELFYALALEEIERGKRRPGLWAKSLALEKGNETSAKGRYLRLLVVKLIDEHKDRERLLGAPSQQTSVSSQVDRNESDVSVEEKDSQRIVKKRISAPRKPKKINEQIIDDLRRRALERANDPVLQEKRAKEARDASEWLRLRRTKEPRDASERLRLRQAKDERDASERLRLRQTDVNTTRNQGRQMLNLPITQKQRKRPGRNYSLDGFLLFLSASILGVVLIVSLLQSLYR